MRQRIMFWLTILIILAGLIWWAMPVNQPQMLINFKSMSLPTTPNYFLACPKNYCNVPANAESKNYPYSVEELSRLWKNFISENKSIVLLAEKDHGFTYQQRVMIIFPDFINVKLLELAPNQSTIAILSQSKYGYSDLGVNKKRVLSLLSDFDNYLGNQDP